MDMARTLTSRVVIGAAAAALVMGAGAGSAFAADPAYADPPSPAVLTQTTNAMLQPGDVPAALGGGGALNSGYVIPPGGQDPTPLCYGDWPRRVLPSLTNAIGYSNSSGQVTEEAYVYPSAEAAQAAWATLDAQIVAKCAFKESSDGTTITSTQGRWASGNQMGRWVNMNNTQKDNPSMYSVVGPVDNAIVITRFQGKKGLKATTAAQRGAVSDLFGVLSARYADRDGLEQLQPELVSKAQQAMLMPSDVPASLPLLAPGDGGWSNVTAQVPSSKPFNFCNTDKPLLPNGTGAFEVNFGGGGDVFITTGMVYERAFTFDSAEQAQAAWDVLTKNVQGCNDSFGKLYAKGGNRRTTNGTTSIGDLPGLWVRNVDSESWSGNNFVSRTYQVYTMQGDVIVGVQYGVSKKGLKPVPLDEAAVEGLAATAIAKWNSAE